MADYYHKLSILLPLPQAAVDFIRQIDAALTEVDAEFPSDVTPDDRELLEAAGPTHCEIAWEEGDRWTPAGVWIGGDDANPSGVAHLARLAIKRFEPRLVLGFQWSHDCSRLKLDAFGGGAVVVGADSLEFFRTSEWLAQRSAGVVR